jgi:peroxisomal enoyl-CoA hydratase 2
MNSTVRLPRVLCFPIEAGHIQLFARAIGDANPIYTDPSYAERSAMSGIIAPPTFSEAGNHFDLDWPYRPRWERSLAESAAAPAVVERTKSGTAMHAETHFVYHRPMRPGMVLSARPRLGKEWQKSGPRSGELKFHEVISEFIDADGAPVVDCTTVVLQTQHTVAPTEPVASSVSATDFGSNAASENPSELPRRGANIAIGDIYQDVLVRNLTRAQIVQYAGASGDFSLQHIDEVYNTQVAGYPSVFAHGMLTMGMAGRVLTDFIGDGRLKKFGFQFRQQVWPGDSLFAALEVTNTTTEPAPLADLTIVVTNQQGQLVGKGYASASVKV